MRASIIAVPALLLAGCVTSGKYQAQERRADYLSVQLDDKTKKFDELKKQHDELVEAGRKLELSLADAQKSNKDLTESLEANKGQLTQKVGELIKERDALAAQVGELRAQVETAERARKELEAAKEAELARVKQSYEDLTAGLKAEIAAGEVTITQLKGKLTVNLVDRVVFNSGEAELNSAGRRVIDKVGELLKNVRDKDIRIEGHTDNVAIGGDLKKRFPTNWELSAARATAVGRYLQDSAKIDPQRIIATGYGEYRPVAANDTPENRSLNRRIEIVLVARE